MSEVKLEKMAAELAELDEKIAMLRESSRGEALDQIKSLMLTHALTIEDVIALTKKPRKKRGPNKPKGDAQQAELI